MAYKVLEGVGDKRRGEWYETNGPFLHVRRRLSESEDLLVGPVIDIRCTTEARERALVLPFLDHVPDEMLIEEVGVSHAALTGASPMTADDTLGPEHAD